MIWSGTQGCLTTVSVSTHILPWNLFKEQLPNIDQLSTRCWLAPSPVPSKAEFWVGALQFWVVEMASAHPEPHHFLGVLHTLLVSPAKQRQEGANKESLTLGSLYLWFSLLIPEPGGEKVKRREKHCVWPLDDSDHGLVAVSILGLADWCYWALGEK